MQDNTAKTEKRRLQTGEKLFIMQGLNALETLEKRMDQGEIEMDEARHELFMAWYNLELHVIGDLDANVAGFLDAECRLAPLTVHEFGTGSCSCLRGGLFCWRVLTAGGAPVDAVHHRSSTTFFVSFRQKCYEYRLPAALLSSVDLARSDRTRRGAAALSLSARASGIGEGCRTPNKQRSSPQGAWPASRSTRRVLKTTGAIAAVVLVAIVAGAVLPWRLRQVRSDRPGPQMDSPASTWFRHLRAGPSAGRTRTPAAATTARHDRVLPLHERAMVSDFHPHQQSRHLRKMASCAADCLYGLGDDGSASGSFENRPYAFFSTMMDPRRKSGAPSDGIRAAVLRGEPHVPALLDLSTLQMLSATDGSAACSKLPRVTICAATLYWLRLGEHEGGRPALLQTIPPRRRVTPSCSSGLT